MDVKNQIEPAACANMDQIRNEIDYLDRTVVALLGKRLQYVKAASKFKKSPQTVQDPERFKAMLRKRGEWAAMEGLNPGAIEKLYNDLVTHFVDEEIKAWKEANKQA
jgi:isochorismate pyruvate lyase